MKKYIALLLALALAFGVTACNKSAETPAPVQPEAPAVDVPETPVEAEPAPEEPPLVPNPVTEVTAQEVLEQTGIALTVPEQAQEAAYQIIQMDDSKLAQATYTLDGAAYTYRATPAGLPNGALADISGLYYEWTSVKTGTVGWNDAELHFNEGEAGYITWYDFAPGLLYCLSMDSGASQDALLAAAELIYVPTQDDVDGDREAALSALLDEIAADYHPGTAGSSLIAAQFAGRLLDLDVDYALDDAAWQSAAKNWFANAAVDALPGQYDQLTDIQAAALALVDDETGDYLASCGYEATHAPWDAQRCDAVFAALLAGAQQVFVPATDDPGAAPAGEEATQAVQPEALPCVTDLDNDGLDETITLNEVTVDVFGNVTYQLQVETSHGVVYTRDMDISYNCNVYLWDIDGDGNREIFADGDVASDDYITYCWRWSGDLEAIGAAADPRYSADEEITSREYVNGSVEGFDAQTVTLGSYINMLGTYGGLRDYQLNADGQFDLIDGQRWVFPDNENWLTVIRDLPVNCSGQPTLLVAGTQLRLTGSDGVSAAWFETQEGQEGYIPVQRDAQLWGWSIDGVNEAEYFSFLPYSG